MQQNKRGEWSFSIRDVDRAARKTDPVLNVIHGALVIVAGMMFVLNASATLVFGATLVAGFALTKVATDIVNHLRAGRGQ